MKTYIYNILCTQIVKENYLYSFGRLLRTSFVSLGTPACGSAATAKRNCGTKLNMKIRNEKKTLLTELYSS